MIFDVTVLGTMWGIYVEMLLCELRRLGWITFGGLMLSIFRFRNDE